MLAARPHRPGFTLAELLVVIAIIAVLGALVSAGVFKILEAIPKTTTTQELSQLTIAVENFKLKYGMYPPSAIVLPPPAGSASATYLSRIWSRIDFAQCSWGGAGTLEGDQCLVYFLQGPTGDGWSTKPQNPTQAGGTRILPFFNFKQERLYKRGGSDFYSYKDPYVNVPSKDKPYAFFSSSPGYANDCPSLISGGPYTKNGKFMNPTSFQIISAGRDQTFGSGGVWAPNNNLGDVGFDDQSNFSSDFLGVAP